MGSLGFMAPGRLIGSMQLKMGAYTSRMGAYTSEDGRVLVQGGRVHVRGGRVNIRGGPLTCTRPPRRVRAQFYVHAPIVDVYAPIRDVYAPINPKLPFDSVHYKCSGCPPIRTQFYARLLVLELLVGSLLETKSVASASGRCPHIPIS